MARLRNLGLLLLAASFSASVAAAEGIAWRSDPEAAKREAAASGRLVLLHFSGTYCPPCRMMEQTVFNRADVAQAVERNYVPVAVDIQKNPTLSQQYDIRKIPADVIVAPSGQVIHKSVGGKSAADYLTALSRVAESAHNPAPGSPFSQNGSGIPTSGQPPANVGQGSYSPEGPGGRLAAGGNGAGGGDWKSPGAQPEYSPFAPRVGQQYTPEASGQPPPGLGPMNPNPQPPSSPPVGPTPSWQSPAFGEGVNRGSGSLPPWSTTPGSTTPGIGTPPGGQPFSATPPGASPFSPDAPPRDPAAGAPPFAPQGQQPSTPPQPRLPPLGFDGFCPVTMYHQERWAPGDRRWGVIHEGRLYLFVSPEAKDAFFRDPTRYAPVFSGDDVVIFAESGQRLPGQVRIGAKYTIPGEQASHTYLFASEQSYQKFSANPMLCLERLRQVLSGGAVNR